MPKRCPNCGLDLNEPYIRCADCNPAIDMCPTCFAKGREFGQHLNNHSYEVRSSDFPLFVDDWNGSEEMKMLDNLIDMGYGNWNELAKQLQTKNAEQCMKHYDECYIDNPIDELKLLADSNNASMPGSDEPSPLTLKPCDDPPRPLPNMEVGLDLAGYMPARGDFTTEYDDFAETSIKDIEFDDADDELLTELKFAALDIFYSRLKERHFRKRLIRRYGLINITRDINASYSKPERAVRESLRVFTRLQSPERNEMFIQGVLLQNNLMRQIFSLQCYRKAGLKNKKDSFVYKKLLKTRKEAKIRRNLQNEILLHTDIPISCQIWLQKQFQSNLPTKSVPGINILPLMTRKPVAPLDLTGTPGLEMLSEEEKELCSQIRLLPQQYVAHKNTLKKECQRLGSLRLQQARPLIKIDVNKTKKLYDFFMNKGWIYNTEVNQS